MFDLTYTANIEADFDRHLGYIGSPWTEQGQCYGDVDLLGRSEELERANELLRAGNLAEAEKLYLALLKTDSQNSELHEMLGMLYLQGNEIGKAIHHAQTSVSLRKSDPRHLSTLALILYRAQRYKAAYIALTEIRRLGYDSAYLQGLAGKCLLKSSTPGRAVSAFQQAIEGAPDNQDNYIGLSCALARVGRKADATAVSKKFIERFCPHSRSAQDPDGHVLVLDALNGRYLDKEYFYPGGPFGRKSITADFPPTRLTFHYLFVEHPNAVSVARDVGPIDVVYNNVAVAELMEEYDYVTRVRTIVDTLGLPVINEPEEVAKTGRNFNYKRLADGHDLIFPRTKLFLWDGLTRQEIAHRILEDFDIPFIVRPSHEHGSRLTNRIDSEAALDEALSRDLMDTPIYAVTFHDCCGEDGLYRCYRMAWTPDDCVPTHLNFSDNWDVQEFKGSDEITRNDASLREEEARFLDAPEDVIGADAFNALDKVGRTLGLDLLAIDFSFDRQGQLVIFEANPCQELFRHSFVSDFSYREKTNRRLIELFENLVLRRKVDRPMSNHSR